MQTWVENTGVVPKWIGGKLCGQGEGNFVEAGPVKQAEVPPMARYENEVAGGRGATLDPLHADAVQKIIGAPSLAPTIPRAVVAVANDSSVSVYFDYSARSDSYTAALSNGNTASGTRSPIIVPSSNGVAVSATVTAVSTLGTATSAVSNLVTPTARPGAIAGITGIMGIWRAADMTPVSDNTAIATLPDSSGNGWDFTQSVSTRQPKYRTSANWGNQASGVPAIQFDGASSTSSDQMQTQLNSILTGPVATIFSLHSINGSTNTALSRDFRVLTNELTGSDRGFAIACNDGNASNNGVGGAGNWHSIRGGGDSSTNTGSALTLTQQGATVSLPYLVSVVTGAQCFVNGTRQAPQFAAMNPLLPRANGFTLGGILGDDKQAFKGCLAGIVIVRGRLTDAQRWAMEAWLGAPAGSLATDPTI